MKKILSTLFFLTILLTICAQTQLPYYTGFDNASEQNGWRNYEISSGNRSYPWEYSSFDKVSEPNSLRMSSPFNEDVYIENWFVSPEFDFSNGGVIDSLYYRYTGYGSIPEGSKDTMAVYLLVGNPDPLLASEKHLIHFFRDTIVGIEGEWEREDSIRIPTVNGPAFVGFRHKTDAGWINLNIDNIHIRDTVVSGINELTTDKIGIEVYPNPTEDSFFILGINYKDVVKIRLLDINRKEVDELQSANAHFSLKKYTAGCYFLEVETIDGFGITRIIKE